MIKRPPEWETPLNWETYEQITGYIYYSLGQKADVKIIGHGRDCKVRGKSGVEHQIDVLASHSDGIHEYKTAIECKYWKDNVNKDIVMKVASIIEDAKIDKGVIVCKKSYTDDAIGTARYRNIGLIELSEIPDVQKPQLPDIKSVVHRAEITGITILPSWFNKTDVDQEEVQIKFMELKTCTGETILIQNCIEEFKKELQNQPIKLIVEGKYLFPPRKSIERKFLFRLSKLTNTKSKKELFIDGFILTGKLIELPCTWYPYDEVWLLMKSIFEDKSFTVSRRGIITKNEKE